MRLLAGIELGGTTCVVAVSKLEMPQVVQERSEFETKDPPSTLNSMADFLKSVLDKLETDHFEVIGIASFGPVDLRPDSPTYGYITSTPKPGWQSVDVVGVFRRAFGEKSPIVFDTDVNAPALGEAIAMGTKGPRPLNVVYITVGTGVGVGVYMHGLPVHGLLHPEAGHMMVGHKPGDEYPGCCVFHKSCVEGMVASKALSARAGVPPSELSTLPDSHPVWETVGYYLGALCANVTYMVSPDVIVFGGGIMRRNAILDWCRKTFRELIAGYLNVDKFKTDEGLKEYIHCSRFGNDAGIIGALSLADSVVKKQ